MFLLGGRPLLGILPDNIEGQSYIAGLAVALIAFSVHSAKARRRRAELDRRMQECQARYDLALKRWEEQAASARFDRAVRELDRMRNRYRNLRAARQARLDELGGKVRERQLQRFLNTFAIARADIDGIGPARVATLQSYGIETAADIEERAIKAIPGFGQVYTERLLGWRRAVEARFHFDAARGIDRADIEAVDRGIDAERVAIEHDLRNGPVQLEQLKEQIVRARATLWPELERAAYQLAQATTDRRAQGR
jgi:DNA-binding helix-hairpin-helix protein with protein kinase domain